MTISFGSVGFLRRRTYIDINGMKIFLDTVFEQLHAIETLVRALKNGEVNIAEVKKLVDICRSGRVPKAVIQVLVFTLAYAKGWVSVGKNGVFNINIGNINDDFILNNLIEFRNNLTERAVALGVPVSLYSLHLD